MNEIELKYRILAFVHITLLVLGAYFIYILIMVNCFDRVVQFNIPSAIAQEKMEKDMTALIDMQPKHRH